MRRIIDDIKKFFSKNLPWKLFSLFAAIFLWFVVMNIINPTETKSFTVDLSLINEDSLEDAGLAIINKSQLEQTKVEIKVQATRPALDELSKQENKSRIKASVDLQNIDLSLDNLQSGAQPYSVTVKPALPSDLFLYSYDIVSYTPNNIVVNVDRLETLDKEITVDYIGVPKSGYVQKTPVFSVDSIQVKGPSSELTKVSDVRVSVDITDAASDVTVAAIPEVYDSDGNVLTEFVVQPEQIEVTIGINKQGQIAVQEPTTIGQLNNDLILRSIDWSPKYIEVEGNAEDLIGLDTIKLPDIDLSTVSGTEVRTFDVRPYIANTNLQLKNGTPNEISVTINIEGKKSKDIQITANKLKIVGLNETLRAQVPGTISVTILGAEELLNEITADTVNATVDFSGLGEGWHNVDMQLNLPANVELKSSPTVYIMLRTKKDNTEASTETTSENTTQEEPSTDEEPAPFVENNNTTEITTTE